VIDMPEAAWRSRADEGFDTAEALCSLSFW
jgi:hypothetical protein